MDLAQSFSRALLGRTELPSTSHGAVSSVLYQSIWHHLLSTSYYSSRLTYLRAMLCFHYQNKQTNKQNLKSKDSFPGISVEAWQGSEGGTWVQSSLLSMFSGSSSPIYLFKKFLLPQSSIHGLADLFKLTAVVIQSLSHVWLFVTPWTAACQTSLSFTVCWSFLKLMSIESVVPSNHLILCHPLSSPALNFSQHQGLFQWVSSSHWVAKVLELQLQY